MKKKGFTLIELLAVIIVLAIIALIAMPIIFNVIENAKLKSLENSAYGVVDAVRLQYMENLMNSENGEVPLNGSVTALPLSGEHPTGGNWEIKNGSEVTEGRGIKITDVTFASMQGYVCNSEEDANNNLTGKVICSKQSQGTPTITFELADGTINNNGWAKANFNVKITATGTTGLKYCLSTSECTPNQDVPSNGIDVEVEGTNYVCAVAEGVSVKCNAYNLDKTTPTLTAKESTATLTLGESKEISTYLNTATYGPSNGSVVCKTNGSEITNTSGLAVGSHTVTCVATSNSGLSSSDVTLTITVEEETTSLIILAVDANSNGVAELGDEVCIGNECFYVLTNDGINTRMLSKYGIDVSDNTTRKDRLQNTGTLSTTFTKSIVEGLVGDYKTTLEGMGATISEATLLTYDEVKAAPFNCNSSCNRTYSWLTSSYYWISPIGSDFYYVLGSGGVGSCSSNMANYHGYTYGVRPVITISSSSIVEDMTIPTLSVKDSTPIVTEGKSNEITKYLNEPVYGPSGGGIICKNGTIEITDTKDLAQGTHTITCNAVSSTGISSSVVTITITVKLIALTVDANSNGVAELGDEVCIGSECFYVLTNDGINTRMLSKYGIDVSDNTTRKDRLQNTGTLNTTFTKSIVEGLVGDYKTTLEGMGATISEATLLTYDEVKAAPFNCNSSCNRTYSWLTSSYYWISPIGSDFYYVLGSGGVGSCSSNMANYHGYTYGVRPVITISSSSL